MAGIALTAHGIDMMNAGRRAWNTDTLPQTQTERAVRSAALRAHASPAIAGLAGAVADALIPGGLLHAAGSFAATRAIRVASADAGKLTFRHADITTEHFHRPSPYTPQPPRSSTNQNLLSPPIDRSGSISTTMRNPHIITRRVAMCYENMSTQPMNISSGGL